MLPNQPYLSAPTPPNVQFTQIACSTVGSRVFLLGNGCVWELVYEVKSSGAKGWIGALVGFGGTSAGNGPTREPHVKNWTVSMEGWSNILPLMGTRREPVTRIVVDSGRQLLYTLNSSQQLQRFSLTRPPSNSFAPGGLEPKPEGLISPIANAQRQTEGNRFFDAGTTILGMDVIERSESDACLVLTTSSRSRIYLKDGSSSSRYGSYGYGASGPSGLHVAHIRLPIESVPVGQGQGVLSVTDPKIEASRYMHGVFVTIHSPPPPSQPSSSPLPPSTLVWYAPDTFEWADLAAKRQQGQMIPTDVPGRGSGFPEWFGAIHLSSQVIEIAEERPWSETVSLRDIRRVVKTPSGLEIGVKDTHEMVTEVTVSRPPPRRRFVVMTTGGVTVYEKTRPMDLLEYFYANGLARTDAVLGIQRQMSASVSPLLAIDLAIAAANGQQPYQQYQSGKMNGGAGLRVKDYVPSSSAQGALDHLVNWSNEQQKQKTLYHQHASTSQWKLDAVYLHLSRCLRSVWGANVFGVDPRSGLATSAVPVQVLLDVQTKLESLQSVLVNRTGIFSSVDPTFVPTSAVTNGTVAATGNPSSATSVPSSSDSFNPARVLLAQAIQAISFVILLSEFRFESVLPRCDPALQRELTSMTWTQLIVDPRGRDLSKRLVTNIVNQQIAQDLSIELISDKLQDRCPSFCSRADVELYKAMESLRKAKELTHKNVVEQRVHLDSSLDNFIRAAPGLTEEKMREVVLDYCVLGYPAGCIQLPIEKAERTDPNHLAFTYYLDGKKQGDPRESAYVERLKYYLLALSTVEKFDTDAATAPTAEAIQLRDTAYDYALNTGDDLFLMTLYQWMVQKGKSDTLLELDNDQKVEAYLRHRGLTSGEPGLLWRFYARRNRHFMAAQALRDLAEASSITLPMAQRVECLALASMHAKSSTMQDSERAPVDFVTELEETNDVANIQLEIWQAIANDPEVTEEGAAKAEQLQTRLISISEVSHFCLYRVTHLSMRLTALAPFCSFSAITRNRSTCTNVN